MLNSIFGKKKDRSSTDGGNPPPGAAAAAVNYSITEFDPQYYEAVRSSLDHHELNAHFWPPVRQGKLFPERGAVCLKQLEFVVEDTDLQAFLRTTEVFKALSAQGLEATLSKSSSRDGAIFLALDPAFCDAPGSYEIQVGNNHIIVVAAEKVGLLYALSSLLQYLKLHSERSTTSTTVPAAVISDRPDFSRRAVLWSYKQLVRSPPLRMQERMELLTRMHINAMYLVVDEPSPALTDTQVIGDVLKVAASASIDVIPAVVVTSVHQG
jgi:hypothetical protein